MILSNRGTPAGVEIMAVSESEVASVTAGVAMRAMTAPPVPRSAAEHKWRKGSTAGQGNGSAGPANVPSSRAHADAAVNAAEPAGYNLVQEVRILRSMLEGQLAAFAWRDLAGCLLSFEHTRPESGACWRDATFLRWSSTRWMTRIGPAISWNSTFWTTTNRTRFT
jgi:hypothetical protein